MILTRAEKVRLGAFLISGTAVFVISLVVLAGLKLWEDRDVYYVSFHESINGLEPSAQVKYQGLRVGRVESLKVDPEDPSAILAELSLEADTALYEGTRAALDMSGLTGLKTINLTPGDPRSPRLKSGGRIPEEASLMGKLGDRAEMISKRVERVTDNLALWTSPENMRKFQRLMDSTAQLIEDVDVFVNETRQPLVNALDEVSKTGAAFRKTSDEASKTIADTRIELRETLASTRKTLDETRRILAAVDEKDVRVAVASASSAMRSLDKKLSDEELDKAFTDLRGAVVNLTTLIQNMDLTVRASREDLVLSLKHVRQATEDLREFSRIIAQDPSVLLRGTEVSE